MFARDSNQARIPWDQAQLLDSATSPCRPDRLVYTGCKSMIHNESFPVLRPFCMAECQICKGMCCDQELFENSRRVKQGRDDPIGASAPASPSISESRLPGKCRHSTPPGRPRLVSQVAVRTIHNGRQSDPMDGSALNDRLAAENDLLVVRTTPRERRPSASAQTQLGEAMVPSNPAICPRAK